MHRIIAALLAIVIPAAAPLHAQPTAGPAPAASAITDQSFAMPVAGSWSYGATSDGSAAIFFDRNSQPRLRLQCSRAIRRVTLSKPFNAASVPASGGLAVWTSTQSRSLGAGFDAATGRLNAPISNWDPLLDAIAYSRGRFAVAAGGQQPLVVPAWGDISRVIEDCRA
ncbi:MAG: hypothetical protein ABIW33_05775 [Sphingomicrobium sp.]